MESLNGFCLFLPFLHFIVLFFFLILDSLILSNDIKYKFHRRYRLLCL